MAKIVLFGQAPFGKAVFDGLRAKGHEITAVSVPPDREGARLDPLGEAAADAGVRLVQRRSYKADDAAAEVDAGAADVGVLAFVTQIIPLPIVDAPKHGSVCFHPSLLPAYRGGSAIPWQLINGETRGGIALFRTDAGMDTGPIYLTRELEIGPDDSAGSYYYRKVFDVGVEATIEATEMALAGVEPTPQDESLATYDPLCRDEHAVVQWVNDSKRLHDLVRGCDPAPGAHARFGSQTLRLFGSKRSRDAAAGDPGIVLAIDDDGIEVATADGALRFAKLRAAGAKGKAAEVAAEAGIAVGARLDDGVSG